MKYSRKVKTLDQAMNSKSVTIGTMQREKGKGFTEGLLKIWLLYLNDVLNLNKSMSEDQIELCAAELANEYFTLKFSDLTLIFKRIVSGYYGELYESISTPKVLTWFREYFDERCGLAEQQSVREHQNQKSDESFNYSKNVRRLYDGTSKHLNKK